MFNLPFSVHPKCKEYFPKHWQTYKKEMERLLWSKKPALKILSRCWYNNICSGYPEPDPRTIIPPHHSPGSILLSNTIKQFVLNINMAWIKSMILIWLNLNNSWQAFGIHYHSIYQPKYIECSRSILGG